MSHKYIITKMPIEHPKIDSEKRFIAALVDERELIDIKCIQPEEEQNVSSIYAARVDQIAPQIHSIFVTISDHQKCYLPYDEVKYAIFTNKQSKKEIAIGDELLVQVVRAPMKTKLATVSTVLTLKGHYAVVTSGKPSIGISKKIDAERRMELQTIFSREDERFKDINLVIRTNATGAEDECVVKEVLELKEELSNLIHFSKTKIKHTCVYRELPDYCSVLNDALEGTIEEVITDDEKIYKQISQYMEQQISESRKIPCRLYQDEYPLYHLYSLQKKISDVLSNKVWLRSGAYLIIEPTEALTVIDVNSGKNCEKDRGDYFLKINKEAAHEIAKQLRLRNISGICIVDFIDMEKQEHRDELLSFMKQECRKDPVKTTVVDMTKLYLMEITRKKTDSSFFEQILRRKA